MNPALRTVREAEAVVLSLRFVIDTNALISAAINPAGLRRTALRLAVAKPNGNAAVTPRLILKVVRSWVVPPIFAKRPSSGNFFSSPVV
jgi:hypothetical protein